MTTSTKMPLVSNAVGLFAIACTALPLMPAGAHLLELPNKLGLRADEYLIVQQRYRGWALAGVIVAAALISKMMDYARVDDAYAAGLDTGFEWLNALRIPALA